MSQSHDPKLDEVRRVLRRIQDLGVQSELAAPRARRQPPPGLNQRLAALSADPRAGNRPTPRPVFSGEDLEDAAHDRPASRGARPKIIFTAGLVGASVAVLALFAGVASIKREIRSSQLAESLPSVAMALRPASQGPQASGPSDESLGEPPSDNLAGAARLVAPAEWTAPAGVATKLPLSVEPQEARRNYQVLISGLEASAFVVKGTEIIAGTWIVPASELANAMVVRNANAPGRTIVTVELRAESGEVASQAKTVLFAQPSTLETGTTASRPN
jgi:hypothetical protein